MKILFGSFGQSLNLSNIFIRMICAIVVGMIIGIERERKNRPAGLRTHVLVCMAATIIAIIEQQMVYEVSNLANAAVNISIGRLSVGVISGIGFIGAGTIMMSKSRIVGLTTAASLWCTACLGLANGMGYCLLAVISAIVVILVLKVLRFSEKNNISRIIEVQFDADKEIETDINVLMEKHNIKIHDSSVSYYKENDVKYCISRYSITFKNNDELKQIMLEISNIVSVNSVKIENVI